MKKEKKEKKQSYWANISFYNEDQASKVDFLLAVLAVAAAVYIHKHIDNGNWIVTIVAGFLIYYIPDRLSRTRVLGRIISSIVCAAEMIGFGMLFNYFVVSDIVFHGGDFHRAYESFVGWFVIGVFALIGIIQGFQHVADYTGLSAMEEVYAYRDNKAWAKDPRNPKNIPRSGNSKES